MPLFNSSTARSNAAKALEARRRNTAERKILVKALLAGSAYSGAQARMESAAPDDGYVNRRLQRVRLQIEKVEEMLEGAEEPAQIDRLASAISRLSEIERTLAGRPLPGSRRPSADRSKPICAFTPPTDA